MEITSTKELDIFKYKSVIEFLNDVYNSKKKIDSQFSYELLASELDFKSRSMVRMIFKGQIKMTDTFINRLASYLKLDQKQTDYFILLSHYHNTNVTFLKNTYFNRINEMSNFIEDETEISDYDLFLSSVEIPTIYTLLSYEDTEATAEFLCQITGYSTEMVESALEVLEKIGLATSDNGICWKSTTKNIKLNNTEKKQALDQYHQQTVDEMKLQISKDYQGRKFRSVYLTLDEDNFQSFNEEIDAFIQKTKNKYISKQLQGKKLYKFNTQAYPVTEKLEVT